MPTPITQLGFLGNVNKAKSKQSFALLYVDSIDNAPDWLCWTASLNRLSTYLQIYNICIFKTYIWNKDYPFYKSSDQKSNTQSQDTPNLLVVITDSHAGSTFRYFSSPTSDLSTVEERRLTLTGSFYFTFWIILSLRLSLRPKFWLTPDSNQKMKSFFVWAERFAE